MQRTPRRMEELFYHRIVVPEHSPTPKPITLTSRSRSRFHWPSTALVEVYAFSRFDFIMKDARDAMNVETGRSPHRRRRPRS